MSNAKLNLLEVRGVPVYGLVTAVVFTLLPADAALGQFAPQFPAASQPPAATATPDPKVEAYPLTASTRDVLTTWQQQSAGRTDIRVAIDERTGQALVFAPPAVHTQIQQQLAAKAPAAVAPPAAPTTGLAAPGNAVLVPLRQMPASEVHARLEGLLGHPLPATVDASGEWQNFLVEASPGAGVSLSVNMRSSQIRFDGSPPQVAAWRSVIEALDSPPTSPDRVTKLVATKPSSHDRVRQTLQVLQSDGANRLQGSGSLVATLFQQPNTATGDLIAQNTTTQPAGAAPAAAPAAPGATTPPSTQVAPGSAQTALDAARLAEASGGLLGPVQVEFVEGLDVIVLRGSEKDVQRVMEIIKQIEELSTVMVPEIKVYELKFVDSVQMGALLQRLYEQVLGPRLGALSVTPLGRPNALLLIGRTENVKKALELVQQLDLPVIPTARFEVFPLKHASAAEAKTLVDGFMNPNTSQTPGQATAATTPAAGSTPASINASTPAFPPKANVVADQRTNSLIVSATPRDIAEIAGLISRIDTPGAAAELKVFTIVNGDASALRDMLSQLFSVSAEPQGGAAGGGANATQGSQLGQGGPVRMQFSVDTRTNSIIAVGSREDLAVVEAILLRLDEGDLRERQTTVYRLNNAFAQEVAVALNQWLQTEKQVETQTEITLSPFEQIEREVIIVPEGATNSLIVSATPRYYNQVIKVIKELDERPPMVLIQVMIAEVTLNDTDEFGVELGLQDSLLFDRSAVGALTTTNTTQQTNGGQVVTTTQNIVNAPLTPGFNFNNLPLGNNGSTVALARASQVATQGLSSFSLNRVNSDLGFGGFVFSASSNSVSMLLRALQEKRRLEVLSRPQLMAMDGQTGFVQVGQNVPRILSTNTDVLGGQTNNITYEPVGLILQVVPRISPDGLVVMQITANKSEVGPEADGIPISVSANGTVLRAPRIDITQALTTVSALSGQTVVLGGLLQTRKNDVHRRVPIISDIPLIGDLFRYDSVFEQRRELLIILTPQIVYNKMDSDLCKQIESSRMSWVLSDVINLHGEAGLRSRCDEWYDGEMESIYPNLVPEEGLLPLSPGQAGPAGESTTYPAGCDPNSTPPPPPANNGEPLPMPSIRQSPSSNRPTNERYGVGEPTDNSVRPAIYQETPTPQLSATTSP